MNVEPPATNNTMVIVPPYLIGKVLPLRIQNISQFCHIIYNIYKIYLSITHINDILINLIYNL